MRTSSIFLLALAVIFATARAQVVFQDVGSARGILPYHGSRIGSGLAAADYDEDGDIDVFVPNGQGWPNQLYRNSGNGRYEEIAADVGLASRDNDRMALWFDYDGDADLDLVVAGDCFSQACQGTVQLRLYRLNTPTACEDGTERARLPRVWLDDPGLQVAGAAAGDIDRDGDLDLVVTSWAGRARLFRNAADGTFEEIGQRSNVGVHRSAWQPLMHDFDGDGWLDILVAVDAFEPNLLWINRRDGTFADEAAEAGVDDAMNGMGIALGDYDNDADFDVFVTNIFLQEWHNVLYRRDAAGPRPRFTEVAALAGVADAGWGWGATFLDADNDGWLDLAVTNGFEGLFSNDRSRFFWNAGGDPVRFEDRSEAAHFADTDLGSALVAFDSDRDGALDLMQTCIGGPLRLLENKATAGNHWIVVVPRALRPNHHAIGAVVRVYAGRHRFARAILAGCSYLGQEPAEACFGLGESSHVDAVIVEWPDGAVTRLENVPADRIIRIQQDEAAASPRMRAGSVRAFPNPSGGATRLRFLAAAEARLRIFDPAGRLLWSAVVPGTARGEGLVTWDGRDHAGRSVAAGTYLVRVDASGRTSTGRISILR